MKRVLGFVAVLAILASGCKSKHHVVHGDHFVGALQSQSLPTITYKSIQPIDGGAIPSGATDGFDMTGVTKFTLTVCACFLDGGPGGGNLSGTGTVKDFVYPLSAAQWSRNPGMDWTASATGAPCESWGDVQTLVNAKRFKPVADNITTTDGGTAVMACVFVDYVQE